MSLGQSVHDRILQLLVARHFGEVQGMSAAMRAPAASAKQLGPLARYCITDCLPSIHDALNLCDHVLRAGEIPRVLIVVAVLLGCDQVDLHMAMDCVSNHDDEVPLSDRDRFSPGCRGRVNCLQDSQNREPPQPLWT